MGILDKEEHELIRDESKTGFESTTDKGLVQTIDFKLPSYTGTNFSDETKKIERAKIEMTRRLKKEIQRFNLVSSKQTKWIIRLTIAMLIVGVSQIGLLLYSLFTRAGL